MAGKTRPYTVSGIDDQGDMHSNHTNDALRAQGMKTLMAEDLEEAEIGDSAQPGQPE